jgi:hypothetical protein
MKPIRSRISLSAVSLLAAGLLGLPLLVQAQPSAHYVPGVEGIKGASLPPPGFYLRDYNVAYFSSRLNDATGHEVPGVDANAFIYANVPRLVWITDVQILGGNLGVDALLPLQYTDLDIKAGPNTVINNGTFGIGDLFAEGTWSKHIKQFDFSAGAGFWAPTGNSAAPPTTRAGLGYWTAMLTAGATWYIDSEKKWSVSALNRYEFNTAQEDTQITPGQAYTLEYGVGYGVSKTVDVGVTGYYQQQVTADSGPGASSQLDRVAGVGPEVSVFYPRVMLGWSLRYVYEFMAESRLQGNTVTLTITKRF